jgi:predicted nucleic acid-binding protein
MKNPDSKEFILDADVLIEAERGNATALNWLNAQENIIIADAVRFEFLLGAHQIKNSTLKEHSLNFFRENLSDCPAESHTREDFENAARIVGEAWRENRGKPSMTDGLLSVLAQRTGRVVATRNLKDFKACGAEAVNPLA